MTWQLQAYQFLHEGNYGLVQEFYEKLIETEPENPAHYWYLGLAYLLNEQEENAQTTWLLAMSQGEEEQVQEWTTELIEILETEAQRQQEQENYQLSWLIRAHLREIEPTLINNLLSLIYLEICLKNYSPKHLEEWQLIEILQENHSNTLNSDLLLQVLSEVLEFPAFITVEFAKASQKHIPELDVFLTTVESMAIKMAYNYFQAAYAADLIQVCLERQPNNLDLLDRLFWFNFISERYSQALETAERFYQQAPTLSLKVFGQYKILHALLRSGAWLEAQSITKDYSASLHTLINTQPIDLLLKKSLQAMTMPLFYLQDNPRENRYLQNQLSRLFKENLQPELKIPILSSKIRQQSHCLKIGYIAHTLRRHSIGWLSRWLLHYRNREAFQVMLYLVSQPEDELTQQWFRQKADLTYYFSNNPEVIATQIRQDEIDILVDLDSITHAITYEVMALKPAPIQVSWLGFDGSGLPTIDYLIGDRYVFPEDAQEYYQETIWRLPHCYMAVDGFETGVPTLRREHLSIPDDAITYLSAQTGLKRHPDTIGLQMKILKAVPNSYFLIQGLADRGKVEQLFLSIAEKEGVSPERLRFLPYYPTETYRANLSIADVVLDTYPFNGGTMTIDMLWQGIPVVTKVGQQWASRNGYTLLTNAGLTEGIAWSDEEYVEWGIKLGTDEKLRQQIAWKLRTSRKTSPLWNARQFTTDMENAYQQMWSHLVSQ